MNDLMQQLHCQENENNYSDYNIVSNYLTELILQHTLHFLIYPSLIVFIYGVSQHDHDVAEALLSSPPTCMPNMKDIWKQSHAFCGLDVSRSYHFLSSYVYFSWILFILRLGKVHKGWYIGPINPGGYRADFISSVCMIPARSFRTLVRRKEAYCR